MRCSIVRQNQTSFLANRHRHRWWRLRRQHRRGRQCRRRRQCHRRCCRSVSRSGVIPVSAIVLKLNAPSYWLAKALLSSCTKAVKLFCP